MFNLNLSRNKIFFLSICEIYSRIFINVNSYFRLKVVLIISFGKTTILSCPVLETEATPK